MEKIAKTTCFDVKTVLVSGKDFGVIQWLTVLGTQAMSWTVLVSQQANMSDELAKRFV